MACHWQPVVPDDISPSQVANRGTQMSFAQVDYLQKNRFSSTRFVEGADLLDKIKAIKSPEEQDLIRRGTAM